MHSNLKSRLSRLEAKKGKKKGFVVYYKRGEAPEEAVEKIEHSDPVILMPEPVSSIEEWVRLANSINHNNINPTTD